MSNIVLAIYRFVYLLNSFHVPIIPTVINKLFIRCFFSCQIGLGAKIGKGVLLGYGGLGIVIHKRVIIGNNVVIGPGVTIGGSTKKYKVPVIGNNSVICSGAKIIGPIVIGENCVIGANSVVIKNIPNNCLAVGIPAKVIKTAIDISTYL